MLAARAREWGAVAFEVDFMDFLGLLFPALTTSDITALDAWYSAMAAALGAAGVPVQLCMDLPSDALASTLAPAVTNARASEDNFPTATGRWSIGLTSLLYGALDLKPFYDDTWTTAQQCAPDNPYGCGTKETFVELSVVVSVLSTGPLGISDGIGFTNSTLVAYACRRDGLLLKPSGPAAPVDAYFSSAPGWRDGGAAVWAAPSYVPTSRAAAYPTVARAGTLDAPTPLPFYSVLSVDVAAPLLLYPCDLFLAPPAVGAYVYTRWSPGVAAVAAACADGAPAGGCVGRFDADTPLRLQVGGEARDHAKPFELFSLSPLYDNGWALLGELGKVTRASVQRFAFAYPDASHPGLLFAVNGTAGEEVSVALVTGGLVKVVNISFAVDRQAAVACAGTGGAATCSVSSV